MMLPKIDVFGTPYEVWTERSLSIEESLQATKLAGKYVSHAKDQLIVEVATALEAAQYVAHIGVDNNIDVFVDKTLAANPLRGEWQKLMPSATPRELSRYQREYEKCDLTRVDAEINRVGLPLSPGQCLFHCGLWPPNADMWMTTRPLSTTFCPQAALLNAIHRAKAYDAGRIDLFVLQVQSSRSKVFAYKRTGVQGHEHEVLLAAGARLRLRTEELIRSDYTVMKWQAPSKHVPVYVLQVDCD